MREYLTLLPYLQTRSDRTVQVITPEIELIARGFRLRKFCTDENGVGNTLRQGGVGFEFVQDCWLTAAVILRDDDDAMNDSMNAELSADGRVLLKADTLPELREVCQSRLVQHLASCPPVVQQAFVSGDPHAYLRDRIAAIPDPGDVPGFSAMRAWAVAVADRSPTATVFPPALAGTDGNLARRFAAIVAFRDTVRAAGGTHFLRVAMDAVEAFMLHAAIERLPE